MLDPYLGPLDIQTWGIAFDPANGNLYVGNSAGSNASIISGQTNTVIGTIPIAGAMGVAYDSANGNIYFTTTDSQLLIHM